MTPARRSSALQMARLGLLAAIGLSAVSCASFDKQGKKPFATVICPAPEYAARQAVVRVFGRHGFRTLSPASNPILFEGMATPGENAAYKEFEMFDTEVISRAFVDFEPIENGTKITVRAQVISQPETMYEDAKFPILGTRSRFGTMLKAAAAEAVQGSPRAPGPATPMAAPAVPSASRSYQVPLPLEGGM